MTMGPHSNKPMSFPYTSHTTGVSFGNGITRLLEGAVILGGPSKLPQATNQIRTMKLYQALGGLGVLGYSLGYPTHNKV